MRLLHTKAAPASSQRIARCVSVSKPSRQMSFRFAQFNSNTAPNAKKASYKFSLACAARALQHQAPLPFLQRPHDFGKPCVHHRPPWECIEFLPTSSLRLRYQLVYQHLLLVLIPTLEICQPSHEALATVNQLSSGLLVTHFSPSIMLKSKRGRLESHGIAQLNHD